MISVIDMPPPEESMWWRGKRRFDVGFFPSECVRIIGDKVPAHLSLPNTTPVVVVGGGSGGGGSNPGGASSSSSSSSKTQHLLNQSGCSGGSSGENLPTKPRQFAQARQAHILFQVGNNNPTTPNNTQQPDVFCLRNVASISTRSFTKRSFYYTRKRRRERVIAFGTYGVLSVVSCLVRGLFPVAAAAGATEHRQALNT
jgi:hypothetical protein